MEIEISVVMPCLNEEETIGQCIEKCKTAFREHGLSGEIVVSDNGSTDGSVKIAESLGARVVHQPAKGYGNAYRKGIESARSRYIVMGDSDNTYDFSKIDRFITPLKKGYDFVIGNRFKGKILPGAMPWANRYIGNPILSGMLRLLFHTNISDSHCGMRSFTKDAYKKMNLKTTGMEFASEMVINSLRAKLKIAEVPITYYARAGESKLSPVKDAWRHMRFMLLYSPTYLFLIPGMSLMILGLLTQIGISLGFIKILGHTFDTHFMVLACLFSILGFQVANLGLYAKTYAFSEAFEESKGSLSFFYKHFKLEHGLILGFAVFALGCIMDLYILAKWISNGFGELAEVKLALLSLTFVIIGAQTIFSSFFLSILVIEKTK
jgi:glycosyltransferase involved in cell wall biosynthesis